MNHINFEEFKLNQKQQQQYINLNNNNNNNNDTDDNCDHSTHSFGSINALISGSIAGALSRTTTAGFERLTIIQQVQGINGSNGGPFKYDGCMGALKKMVKNEGFLSLFKGNGANIVKVSPNTGIRFLTFDMCKKYFAGNDPSSRLNASQTMASGAVAGLTSTVCTYPLDLIRIRLSLQQTPNPFTSPNNIQIPTYGIQRYNGIKHGFQTIHSQEGFRGLFRGLGTAIFSVAPWVSLNFLSYEIIKDLFQQQQQLSNNYSFFNNLLNNNNNHLINQFNNTNNKLNNPTTNSKKQGMMVDFSCGALSGALTMTICFPLDVLRRRMMIQGIGGDQAVYRNGWHALKTIYTQEGLSAFYKGLKPAYFKVVPTVAISFAVYELCKDYFEKL